MGKEFFEGSNEATTAVAAVLSISPRAHARAVRTEGRMTGETERDRESKGESRSFLLATNAPHRHKKKATRSIQLFSVFFPPFLFFFLPYLLFCCNSSPPLPICVLLVLCFQFSLPLPLSFTKQKVEIYSAEERKREEKKSTGSEEIKKLEKGKQKKKNNARSFSREPKRHPRPSRLLSLSFQSPGSSPAPSALAAARIAASLLLLASMKSL